MKNNMNAFQVNLKIDDRDFANYYMRNLKTGCMFAEIEKALKLYFKTKDDAELQTILATDSDEIPLEFKNDDPVLVPPTREGLLKYAYYMAIDDYDFPPDSYLETMADAALITEK